MKTWGTMLDLHVSSFSLLSDLYFHFVRNSFLLNKPSKPLTMCRGFWFPYHTCNSALLFSIFFFAVFPKVLLRTLKNPIYLLVVMAQANLSAMVCGLATFMAKFLERQFTITASLANLLIGEFQSCRGWENGGRERDKRERGTKSENITFGILQAPPPSPLVILQQCLPSWAGQISLTACSKEEGTIILGPSIKQQCQPIPP